MKRLLQPIQLGQGFNQLENVVLEVRFSQKPLSRHIVQAQPNPGLVQPHLSHDVVEESHDRNSTQSVSLLQLGKQRWREITLTFLTHKARHLLELDIVHHLLLACRRWSGMSIQDDPQLLQFGVVEQLTRASLQEMSSGLLSKKKQNRPLI